MRTKVTCALGLAMMAMTGVQDAHADEDSGAVASIKPIHSLVAGVMAGVGKPHLIVKGAASPHTYALKPSDAEALEHAKVVFWVGPNMESFLERTIDTVAKDAKVIALEEAHGLKKLPFREGGAFEAHDDDHGDEKEAHDKHAGHDHDKKEKKDAHDHGGKKESHDKHAGHDHDKHEKKDAHDHGEKKETHDKHAGHDHDKHEKKDAHAHDAHDHGEVDLHVWLDPRNAKAMVHEIEEALAKTDPKNASKYKANAEALEKRLDSLESEIATTLEPVKDRPFVVFHDAYQYFEKRFGMQAAGSITVSPETLPGAKRLKQVHSKIEDLDAVCVFSEPQFEPKLVKTVTEGTNAKSGELDPVGADIADGPDLYFTLMRNMAKSMKACLSPSS